MNIMPNDIRFCVLIRGTRSSTTKEMVYAHCEKYGHVSYCHISTNPQGIMRGYNVVYKQEQSVNRFMDDRPHRIDGQSVKVRRGIPPEEDWRLTNQILITALDNSGDKQIFNEETLRGYFCKYGTVRLCQIDTYHNRPCAYLTFADFDRVDQMMNDKPHVINKIHLNVRKYVPKDDDNNNNKETKSSSTKEVLKLDKKRREHSSSDAEQHRTKQQRSSTKSRSSNGITKPKSSNNDEINRLKTANELLMQEVQSLISPSIEQPPMKNEILYLQTEYERLTTHINQLRTQQNDNTNNILDKLYENVNKLFQQIKDMRQEKKTFDDELFEKYTIEYILSLTENDIKQRCEQLEKENQLLLLIKQNLINKRVPEV